MKTRFFLITFLTSLVLFSCSKDDSDYIKKSDIIKINGSCKVFLTGTSQNGYSLNESIDLNAGRYNGYNEKDDIISFNIEQRSDEVDGRNYIDFRITYNKTTKISTMSSVYFAYRKILDSKNMIYINESFSNSDFDNNVTKLELNNFNFDSNNSKVSGKLLLSKEYLNSGNNRTMVGTVEFNVSVTKIVNQDSNNNY